MKDQDIYADELLKDEESFDLKKWVFRILQSWYWFAGSLIICLLAAWLYLHYTNPVYQAIASVMIKDEKKGGDISDNSILKELGINSNKLVENEIEVLRSYDLMEEVVRSQKLNTIFSVEGRIRDIPVFGKDVPFQLDLLSPDSIVAAANWTLTIKGNKASIASGEEKLDAVFGSIYSLNGIRFRLIPNEYYLASNETEKTAVRSFFATILPYTAATGMYSGKLSVEPVSKQASVVSLSIIDPHPERAKVILARLIDIYNKQGLDDKNKVTANTIDFLNERLKAVSSDLQTVEGKVKDFKSSNQIMDISADAQQFMDMAKDIDMQRAESQTRLNIVSALERELILNQENPGLVPSTLGLEEVSLSSLIEKHNSLVLERERREKNPEIGPKNPLLIDLREQVQETRRKLLANVKNLKEAYQIALDDVSRKDEQLRRRITNMPQLEQKLVEIKRNQNVEEQLYAYLLQKREEAAVTLASNIPDSRTIVRARSIGAVSPNSKMIWIIAALFGLVVPLLVMLVLDFLNNKVGDAAEVEQKTRIPLLGMISYIRKINTPVVIGEKSRSVVAEQIRALRTSIGFTGKGKEVKKILVTSSQPGDGKSFISINLAASYALLDKKTVLVELDLRKPRVGKYLEIKSKEGLSSILTGKAKLSDVLVEIPAFKQQLFLLPAGYLPPNPAELISGTTMGDVIKELEGMFDYIIIDTPPFGLVTDAVLLQRYADITLAVLRQGHTNKGVYEDLNHRIAQNPDYPLYLILNGVGWRSRYRKYGYGYGKYGGYTYGKSYFDE